MALLVGLGLHRCYGSYHIFNQWRGQTLLHSKALKIIHDSDRASRYESANHHPEYRSVHVVCNPPIEIPIRRSVAIFSDAFRNGACVCTVAHFADNSGGCCRPRKYAGA